MLCRGVRTDWAPVRRGALSVALLLLLLEVMGWCKEWEPPAARALDRRAACEEVWGGSPAGGRGWLEEVVIA